MSFVAEITTRYRIDSVREVKKFLCQLALALQMSHSDAVGAVVQQNDFNTAIGALADSRWPWLEPFSQRFSFPKRDHSASDFPVESAQSVQWKFCWIALNGSDPNRGALPKGRTVFKRLPECGLQSDSPQPRGNLNGSSVSSTQFTSSAARPKLLSPPFQMPTSSQKPKAGKPA